jgi:hypothetical protein
MNNMRNNNVLDRMMKRALIILHAIICAKHAKSCLRYEKHQLSVLMLNMSLLIPYNSLLILFLLCFKLDASTVCVSGRYRYDSQVNISEDEWKRFLKNNPKAFGSGNRIPTLKEFNRPLDRLFRTELDDSGRWKITVVLVEESSFESFVSQYDNHNIIRYPVTKTTNVDVAVVANISVPEIVTSAAEEVPWLAFASGRYFRTCANGCALSLSPEQNLDGSKERVEVPVDFTLFESPPFVPVRIAYGFKPMQSTTNVDTVKLKRNRFHSCEFESFGLTNIGNYYLPTSFRYRRYRASNASNQIPKCTIIVNGEVTNMISASGEIDFSLPKRIAISDCRAKVPTSYYIVTNGVVPATNSSTVIKAQQLKTLRIDMMKQRERNRNMRVYRVKS